MEPMTVLVLVDRQRVLGRKRVVGDAPHHLRVASVAHGALKTNRAFARARGHDSDDDRQRLARTDASHRVFGPNTARFHSSMSISLAHFPHTAPPGCRPTISSGKSSKGTSHVTIQGKNR